MIFRKNKPDSGTSGKSATPRGREQPAGGGGRGANALARRFLVDEEPDTTDLSGAAGFAAETPEPETRTGAAVPTTEDSPQGPQLISHDPESGRFFVHPGTPGVPVLLEGKPVMERTELSKGDRIRIGEAEFAFLG